jgi:hypothetical protein
MGRDATDVAISTQFGPAKLVEFSVVTDEIAPVKADASSDKRAYGGRYA